METFLGIPLNQFLSTPSARRATSQRREPLLNLSDFYPRPPRGGRLDTEAAAVAFIKFLSTPSARRATPFCFSSFH